jgi:uncharacterized protein
MESLKNLKPERLDVVDALRGFALLGIVIVHFMEQYLGGPTPQEHNNYTQHIAADSIFEGMANFLLRGKFFMLFSFLFGLSFTLQMDNAAKRGVNFSGRFLWRLAILFAIGFVHHLFYRGDILTIYAVLDLPLVLFYKLPNRWVLAVAVVLMLGVARFVLPIPDFKAQSEQWEKPEQTYWQAVKSGSLSDVFYQNVTRGAQFKFEIQVNFFGRAYQTFALFLFGLLAGRTRFFENLNEKTAFLKRGLWWSFGSMLGVLGIGALLFAVFHLDKVNEKAAMFVGIGLYDVMNLLQTGVYIFGFLLLFEKKAWWRRQILKLAPYGRMALTNYVMQSLIGTTLFFGFGFHLLGDIGATATLGIAIVVFIAQRYFSDWWLTRYQFGPLEWLWRSATFLTIQPFRK